MPGLTQRETVAFLEEPGHLMRLATTDDDGMPVVVPIWFIHRDGKLLFTPRERSTWRFHLLRDPRAAVTIDEEVAPTRKVIVRGEVETLHELGHDDAWRDIYRDITLRYTSEEWGDRYLSDTRDEPRALLALALDGNEVSTWRMPVKGDGTRDVWAPRYYHR